jgi:hypothetical protein
MYIQICKDFNQQPNEFVIEAVYPQKSQARMQRIQELLLSRRDMKDKLNDGIVLPLFEVFNHAFHNSSFINMDLSYAGLGNAAAKSIATYLGQTQTLIELNLEGNDIGPIGGEHIGQALKKNISLQILNISINPIGDNGVGKIADALLENRSIQVLNLQSTDASVLALTKIAIALNRNCSLVSLRLDSPRLYTIQEETTIKIAKALPYNTNLVTLSLSCNLIKDHGAMWLAEYLEKNVTLTELNLACNKITTTGVAALAAALQNRCVPCLINLDGNPLREQIIDEIDEVLDQNAGGPNGQMKLCSVEYHTNEWPSDSPPFLKEQRHWLEAKINNNNYSNPHGYQ